MDQQREVLGQTLSFEINSSLAAVRPAVERVIAFCRKRSKNLDERIFQQIELCATEAITNIVKHAYGIESSGWIGIFVEASETAIRLILKDAGPEIPGGIDSLGLSMAFGATVETLPVGGMGWFLIKSDMDRVTYKRLEGMNELVLVKYTSEGHQECCQG